MKSRRLTLAAAAGLATIAAGLTPAAAQTSQAAQAAQAAHTTQAAHTAQVAHTAQAARTAQAAQAAQASGPGGRAVSGVTYYTGTPGTAHLLPRSAPATGAPAALQRGARRLPSGRFSATETVPRAPAPAAAGTAAAPLSNFNGVSSRDSQFTNYNLKFEPPDQGVCQGNGFVLEIVNSAYRIYNTNGKSLRGPFNMNDLFNIGGKEFTSDPRCWYDPTTGTWFATVLFLNARSTASDLAIAVRHATSPLGLWNNYEISTTDIANGCPCFGDQPRIGIDQKNFYVTDDEFSITGPQSLGAEIWAFDKAELVAGATKLHFVRFPYLKIAGQLTLAPQPALSLGKPGAEYFLSSLDFTGQGDHRIGVWAMTNRGRVAAGGMPTLSSVVIDSESYANPPPAPQKGAKSTLDSGDDRMQQASFSGGTVWGELTTAVQPSGDGHVRAGGAWFQVKPVVGAQGITGASVLRQGYIDAAGQYVIYPAVQPDAAGNAVVIFTLTSSSRFPGAGYATLKAGLQAFTPPVVAAPGTEPYDPHGTRWGDYSFAVPDSTSHSAWLATEYMPPESSQTTNGATDWGTRVLQIPLG